MNGAGRTLTSITGSRSIPSQYVRSTEMVTSCHPHSVRASSFKADAGARWQPGILVAHDSSLGYAWTCRPQHLHSMANQTDTIVKPALQARNRFCSRYLDTFCRIPLRYMTTSCFVF